MYWSAWIKHYYSDCFRPLWLTLQLSPEQQKKHPLKAVVYLMYSLWTIESGDNTEVVLLVVSKHNLYSYFYILVNYVFPFQG